MTDRPSFVLFVTDQHRADHLGCYGNPVLETPRIDAIAASGARFDQCFVANPFCMPNRASLMTGRMPSAHGVRTNGIPLAARNRTFVELLREAGYRTGLAGKAHLQNMTGWKRAHTPPAAVRASREGDDVDEAIRHGLVGEAYESENTLRWRSDPDHGVSLPYYGFDHVDLCTMHGDLVGAGYERWLRDEGVDVDSLRGAERATPTPGVRTPQAWRTRIPESHYPTAYVAQRAVEFLRAESEGPFFLQCNFPDPHHPFTPPGRYWEMYDPRSVPLSESHGKGDSPMLRHLRRELDDGNASREKTLPYAVSEDEAREAVALTYGMISMVDNAVGDVLDELAALGRDRDTIVLFTSDHGDYMGDHGILLKGPMHYRGLIRVPLLWSEPGGRGSTNDALVSTLDIPATILERAGVAPYYGMQGRDLRPLIDGGASAHRDGVLVEDDRELVYLGFDAPQRVRTLVTATHRLSVFRPSGWAELYDLENDPLELVNLWGEPDATPVRQRLVEELLFRSIDAQDWTPLPTGRA